MLDALDDLVSHYLGANGVETADLPQETNKARDLEAKGWRVVLMTLMPFAFEEEFSADHVKFWDLYWSVLMRLRTQAELFKAGLVPKAEIEQEQFFRWKECFVEPKEFAVLLILGRGLAKSSTIEAAAAIRGCILGGYCLYVCEAQDQAEEHIGNIKGLIDDPDSRLTEFYPHMAIDENAVWRGKKTKNRTDLFITVGGWICRAKGLNSSLRGIRVGNLRPDNICVDDIDGVNDSIAVSLKKLKQLTSSVIPTQARRWATFLVGQNLIGETTVVNLIYTGQTDALSERTEIGVSNTFVHFRLNHEYITYMDPDDGRVRHKILPTAVPTWAGVRISDAQKFLNDSGLETFLAEYMNSFAHLKNEKVFEFDEARHLITWEMFEAITGVRHIPGHWRAKAAADFGYSKESLSAWGFYARAAQNANPAIKGLYFGYRSRTFELDGIDDQAISIWEDLFPDPDTGKRHFEATQRFADYPELFRVLNLRPRCARYLKAFEYDPVTNKYGLKPIKDLKDWQNTPEEDKAMFYVKQAGRTFKSQIQSWTISHEKTGEQKTLAKMYGIPAGKVARYESDAGVTEANHLLRGDYTRPHPFYPDEIVPDTGLYKLGCPFIFFIVRRIKAPEDDRDMKTFREHVSSQRWTQEKLGDLGLTKTIPMKYKSDHCDQFRMFSVDYALPDSTKKTMKEEVTDRIPEQYRPKPDKPMTVEEHMSYMSAKEYAEEKTKIDLGIDDEDLVEDDYEY
jgi:hypothetical protein